MSTGGRGDNGSNENVTPSKVAKKDNERSSSVDHQQQSVQQQQQQNSPNQNQVHQQSQQQHHHQQQLQQQQQQQQQHLQQQLQQHQQQIQQHQQQLHQQMQQQQQQLQAQQQQQHQQQQQQASQQHSGGSGQTLLPAGSVLQQGINPGLNHNQIGSQPMYIGPGLTIPAYTQMYSQPIMMQPNPLNQPQLALNMATMSNGNVLQLPNALTLSKQPQLAGKNVAIAASSLNHGLAGQNQMLTPFKGPDNSQVFKQVMPASSSFSSVSNSAQLLIGIQPNNQQASILPNTNKSNDQRGKLAIGNNSYRSSYVNSPKVISQGNQQIQPKAPNILPQPANMSNQSMMNTSLKSIQSNSLIGGQAPQMINNQQYLIQTGPLLGHGNQQILLRSSNQPDQAMFFQTSSQQFSPFYTINQSGGVHVVTSNATPVISVSSSQSHTATNTTQSVPTSAHPCMIAPATSTPSSTRFKTLKPALPQASVGTQTSAVAMASSQPSSQGTSTATPKTNHSKIKSQGSGKGAGAGGKTPAERTQTVVRQINISPSQAQVSLSSSQAMSQAPTPIQSTQPAHHSIQQQQQMHHHHQQQASQSPNITASTQLVSSVSSTVSSHSTPQMQNSASSQASLRTQSQLSKTMTVTLVSQPTIAQNSNSIHEKSALKPNQSNKADAANQTAKPIATEAKANQATSTKGTAPDKSKGKTSIGGKTPTNGTSKEKPIQAKKDTVEKKDAFTENDTEMMNSYLDSVRGKAMMIHSATPEIQTNNKVNDVPNGLAKVAGKNPQKAIVKPYVIDPNVLTHVIDGYVIQESQSPFPINIDSMQGNSDETIIESKDDTVAHDESGANETISTDVSTISSTPKTKADSVCENCGKVGSKGNKKKKSKSRFCSNACAKKFAANESKTMDIYNPVQSELAEKSSMEPGNEIESKSDNNSKSSEDKNTALNHSRSPKVSSSDQVYAKNDTTSPREGHEVAGDYHMDGNEGVYIPAGGNNPLIWSVQDVYDFVRNLPGCQEYADEFKSQEIDGQALMLLKEDHLMSAMNMKLGPALKICSRINSLFKAESSKSQA